MNPEVLAFFAQHTKPRTFMPGEIIFNQGDPSSNIYYLIEGCALAYTILPDGREKNVVLNWSGQFIGLGTYFEGVPHRAYVIAVHPCSVYILNHELLKACMDRVPSTRDDIILNLAWDIGQLFEKVADSALASTEIRIARFICRRMAKGQCNFRGKFPELNFTQDFIADVVGVSRSAVSDALAYFKRNGWISTGYGHIIVLAAKEVQSFAYGG